MTNETNEKNVPTEEEKSELYETLLKDAKQAGYHINPDKEFVWILMNGLLVNKERFGYMVCPCRLGVHDIAQDRDIICPCDYRDSDVLKYDACYCSLYVSEKVLNGEVAFHSIPESRPAAEERSKRNLSGTKGLGSLASLPYSIWRCRVCGYLCARDDAPEICPICKAKHDRFDRFL